LLIEHSKMLNETIQELEKCSSLLQVRDFQIMQLKFKIEQFKQQIEYLNLTKSISWYEYCMYIYIQVYSFVYNEFPVYLQEIHIVSQNFLDFTTTQLGQTITTLLTNKIHIERLLLLELTNYFGSEYSTKIEYFLNLLFLGLPAFFLAILWHVLTSKIQSFISRVLFGKKSLEEVVADFSPNDVHDENVIEGTEEGEDEDLNEEEEQDLEDEEDDDDELDDSNPSINKRITVEEL
jgi:hypothetical protein